MEAFDYNRLIPGTLILCRRIGTGAREYYLWLDNLEDGLICQTDPRVRLFNVILIKDARVITLSSDTNFGRDAEMLLP